VFLSRLRGLPRRTMRGPQRRGKAGGGITGMQASLSVGTLRRSRCRNRRELRPDLHWPAPPGERFFVHSLKQRERSAIRRGGRDLLRRAGDRLRRAGLALRRSTAAASRLSPRPWDPAALWPRLGLSAPGGDTERARGVCLTPGGLIQGRPGSRLRIATAGAAPRSRSVSPAERPLGEQGCFMKYIINKGVSIINLNEG
jgi:hypothetical protein